MSGPGRRAWLRATLWATLWALGATNDEAWLQCDQRRPCVRQGQCVADIISCPKGQLLLEGHSVCGCCPGCVDTLEEGDECSDTSAPCPELTSCVDGECKKGPCAQEPGHESWAPSCDREGFFQAVQCKGRAGDDGRCFCWSPSGQRLEGQRAWESSAEMNCACSVRAWRLAQAEGEGLAVAPRCAPDGSFEALQCARGVCWCADTRSGAPQRRVAPEGAVQMLFCYKAAEVGDSYRRRCDSQLEARARIEEVMEAHGTTPYGLDYVNCDLDGSFGAVQLRDSGQRFCAWKDKQQILSFQVPATEDNDMNCNCARDTTLLDNTQLRCSSNGNYEKYLSEDSKIYCVDNDGYFMKFVNTLTDSCVD